MSITPRPNGEPASSSCVASAYDSVAAEYDSHLERARWMRRALWRHFDRLFRAGDHVLDVGCGTGIDAIHFASRGVHVTAVDVSRGMLDRLRANMGRTALDSLVHVVAGDVVEVSGKLAGPFDGIISSFAALNTVDLASFAPEAARLIRPGGRLVAHVLSPWHRIHASVKDLWRRFSQPSPHTIEVDIHGYGVAHAVLPEDELYRRFFARDFLRKDAYALGLFIGPSAEHLLADGALDLVARIEREVSAACRLTSFGRFYVLDLQRREHS